MTRLKSTPPPPTINNDAEFKVAVDDIALAHIELEEQTAKLESALAAVREEHAPAIDALKSEITAKLNDATDYAIEHRATLFPNKIKSADCTLATYGFRIGNKTLALLNRSWKWASVLNAVKARIAFAADALTFDSLSEEQAAAERRWENLIVVKEDLKKDEIKLTLSAAEQTSIGCKTTQDEPFFIEPRREAIAERRLISGKAVTA